VKDDKTTQQTALAIRTPMPVGSMAELATAGELLAQSGMFGINNPGAGFVVAATCHQQGISLMEFQRTYHIVDGRPTMKADAMLAEFRKRGGKYKIVANDIDRAEADFEFEGVAFRGAYTMDDAKRTGDCFKSDGKTLKHNWEKRPDDMLWARMVSRSVRRLCPEIVAGLYTPEEVSDFNDAAQDAAPRQARVLTTEEVTQRVKPVQPVAQSPSIDYTVCPPGFGEFSGKPWADMDDETLAMAEKADGLTATHRAAIRVVAEERKARDARGEAFFNDK